jgi:hypothetical protein
MLSASQKMRDDIPTIIREAVAQTEQRHTGGKKG